MAETLPQISFGKLGSAMPMPHLLDIQTRAFERLLRPETEKGEDDIGLERVFRDLFPIAELNENYSLEFVKCAIGEPKYTVEECIERDMTYSAPLKATLRLLIMEEVAGTKRPKNILEKEVYLGELPLLTPLGTFVINGAERVIVSQLHRSPGVVFEETIHPNGQRLFSARIIPFRGSWVEFTIDIHDVVFVHIDKKKKFPATALLRAFGYSTNSQILELFYAKKELDITGNLQARAQRREILGTLLAGNVPNPEDRKGEPRAREGDELTLDLLQALRRAGIASVTVFAGYTSLNLRDEDLEPATVREREVKHVLACDVADPGTGEVAVEGLVIALALFPLALELLGAAVVAAVRVDGHHLDAFGRRAGEHDGRSSLIAADLDDPITADELGGTVPEPLGLGPGHPPLDVRDRTEDVVEGPGGGGGHGGEVYEPLDGPSATLVACGPTRRLPPPRRRDPGRRILGRGPGAGRVGSHDPGRPGRRWVRRARGGRSAPEPRACRHRRRRGRLPAGPGQLPCHTRPVRSGQRPARRCRTGPGRPRGRRRAPRRCRQRGHPAP